MQTLFLILTLLSLTLGMQLEIQENVDLSNESYIQLNFFNRIQPSLCQKYFEKNLNQIYSFLKTELCQHFLDTFKETAKNGDVNTDLINIAKLCTKNAKKVENRQLNKNIRSKVDNSKSVTNFDAFSLPRHIAELSNQHLTSNLSISVRNICILLSMQMFMSSNWSVLLVDNKYLFLYEHFQILYILINDKDFIAKVNKCIEANLKNSEFSKIFNYDEKKFLYVEDNFAESTYFAAILMDFIQILFSCTTKCMQFLSEYHDVDTKFSLNLLKLFNDKSISILLDYKQYHSILYTNCTKLDFADTDIKKYIKIFYSKIEQTKNSKLPVILVFDANLGLYFTHMIAEKLIETPDQVEELSFNQYYERLYDISCYLNQIYFINLIIYLLKSFEVISQRSTSKPIYRNFYSLIYIYDDDVNNIHNYIHNKYKNKFIAHKISQTLTIIAQHFCYISLIFAEALYEFYQMYDIEYFNLDIINAKKFYGFNKDEYVDYTSYLIHGQKVNEINQQEFNEKIMTLQEIICFESLNLSDDLYDVEKGCIEINKIDPQNLGNIKNMDKLMSDLIEKRIKFVSELVKYFNNNCALSNDKKVSADDKKILSSARSSKKSLNEKVYYSSNTDLTIDEACAFINGKRGNVCDNSKRTQKAKANTTVSTKCKKRPTSKKKIVHNIPTINDRLFNKSKIKKAAEYEQTDPNLCNENDTSVQETKEKEPDVRSDIQDVNFGSPDYRKLVNFNCDSSGEKSNLKNKDTPEKNINDLQALDVIKIKNVRNIESEPQNINDTIYEERDDQKEIQDDNDLQRDVDFYSDKDTFILQISKKKKRKCLNNKTNDNNNANESSEEQKSQINHEYKNGNAQIDTCKKIHDNNKSNTYNQPSFSSLYNKFLSSNPNIFAKNLMKLPLKNSSLKNNNKNQPNFAEINVLRSTENDVYDKITMDDMNSTIDCIHEDDIQKFNSAKNRNQHDDASQFNDRNCGNYDKKEQNNLHSEGCTTMNGKNINSNQSLSETPNCVKSTVMENFSNLYSSDAKVEMGETFVENLESMNNDFAASEQKKYINNNSCKFQDLSQNTNDAIVYSVSNRNKKIITPKIKGNDKKYIFETYLIEKTFPPENEEFCFIANLNNFNEQTIYYEPLGENYNESILDITNGVIKTSNPNKVESTKVYCEKCKNCLNKELALNASTSCDFSEDLKATEFPTIKHGLNHNFVNFEVNGHCQYDEKMDCETKKFLKAKTNFKNETINMQEYAEEILDISNESKINDTPSIPLINREHYNDKLLSGENINGQERTINHSQYKNKIVSNMLLKDTNDNLNNKIIQLEHIEASNCDQSNSIEITKNENCNQSIESNKNPYNEMLFLHRTSYTPYGCLPYSTNNIDNPLDNYYLMIYIPSELIEGVKRGDFRVEYLSNGNVIFIPTNYY
ncbi:hypothetical protein COBT_000312 [Conglomerata obtusa]